MARNHPFKVVIAYEDFTCAIRAREMSERLAAQLEPGIGITNQVWRFDLLRNLELREEAVNDGAAADMIIISAHGAAPLPAHVTMWIQSWLTQERNDPAAFVALLGQEDDIPTEQPSLGTYLRQVAEEAGMDFFFKAGGWQQPGFQLAGERFGRQPENDSAMLEEVLHDNYPARREWGIND